MSAARYYVSGKVQGVWFRASAREQALALDLRGYARNLADGRVEVLAVGDEAALARFEIWLRRGPANARVEALAREDADGAEAGEGFVCS
ncbi:MULTISPECIES: acylphosphatase [unclassified Lysobacter]|uniref:acylphosphatase n=1 Tax=unclassified Lysobacter TaxID=2635362 RepID=UPI0006F1FA24|nr:MULTISPECIES: acylphosphatase [unclassified Lysobacter]KRA14447.1 acylphosphatase [Lysobacter sp. Root604]KRD30239.1 acylphosphatase [Lysobacter sp. Root916]